MNFASRLMLAALLVVSAAAFALAADPEPQTPSAPPTVTERPAAPDLDINQAELEAGVTVDLIDPAKSLDGETVSPMIAEIRTTLDQSRVAIAELAARAAATGDHATNLAIQQEIAAAKQQTELDILAIQARYARAGGNEELAQQIDNAIAAIVSPPAPTAPTETRPAPGDQN